MAEKRRIAIAVDPEFDIVNLVMLRSLVEAADAQDFRDDSTFQIRHGEGLGRTFLVLDEVRP